MGLARETTTSNLDAVRPLGALLIYFGVIFIVGALLAPWLYHLAQWLADQFPIFKGVGSASFDRYVRRSFQLVALAGLWPFLRSVGLRSARAVGLAAPFGQWARTRLGIGLGFFSLAYVVLVTVLAGARSLDFNHPGGQWASHLSRALLAAAFASLLEELVFRGVLFGALRQRFNWQLALVISSAVFALLHFLQKREWAGPISWASGLVLLPQMLGGLADTRALVPGFFNLTLVGMILALGYQRTGNLYFSIGLHAGWIFWLKTYGFLTRPVAAANTWIWGSGKLIDGWLAFIMLLIALAICARIPVKPDAEAG
jgi:uncharacterized protein